MIIKIINLRKSLFKLAGRHDKVYHMSIKLQPAYRYVLYLKLMRNLDDKSFHTLKRKYIDTNKDVQAECKDELKKIMIEDSISYKKPLSFIHNTFNQRLKEYDSKYGLSEFNLE